MAAFRGTGGNEAGGAAPQTPLLFAHSLSSCFDASVPNSAPSNKATVPIHGQAFTRTHANGATLFPSAATAQPSGFIPAGYSAAQAPSSIDPSLWLTANLQQHHFSAAFAHPQWATLFHPVVSTDSNPGKNAAVLEINPNLDQVSNGSLDSTMIPVFDKSHQHQNANNAQAQQMNGNLTSEVHPPVSMFNVLPNPNYTPATYVSDKGALMLSTNGSGYSTGSGDYTNGLEYPVNTAPNAFHTTSYEFGGFLPHHQQVRLMIILNDCFRICLIALIVVH
ncbi:hypothetical protein Ciccas_012461 [Cichlidogyrus casuarinus]|uniref:Uncharacterized protein n=1 Tax=Cichlidogyrus casuarinus TaxID=1844966 RepID=A0ABD2PQM6_9PLAT